MNFQTQIKLEKQSFNQIDYNSRILLLGSCFATNIASKLDYFKFKTEINPFGIMFHPLAIETLITHAINLKQYTKEDIFFLNDQWHCFNAHSEMSNTNDDALLRALNEKIEATNKSIKKASHIIITLGTSWVYRYIETDQIVANCHKVPQKQFLKELLPIDEIKESLLAMIMLIKSVNAKANVIFTISPIRHIKDGFIQNNQSKAHLIAAVHQLVEPRKSVYYFPSYEIQIDELRDYRFYADDMLHPSQLAIDHIWRKFSDTWLSESTSSTMTEVDAIQKALGHKPFNSETDSHKKFLRNLKTRIETLQKDHPHFQF